MFNWLFKRNKNMEEEGEVSMWKIDFSDCETADFLPNYSVCKCAESESCRHIAMYSGMKLCSHPEHKEFIPPDSPAFDPHAGQFKV